MELNETQKQDFKKCIDFTDKIAKVIGYCERHFDGDYHYEKLTFDDKFMNVYLVKGYGEIKNTQIQIVFELEKIFLMEDEQLFYWVVGIIQNNKKEIRKKELTEHVKLAKVKIEKWEERKKEILSGSAVKDLEEQINSSENLIKVYEKTLKEIESNEK